MVCEKIQDKSIVDLSFLRSVAIVENVPNIGIDVKPS